MGLIAIVQIILHGQGIVLLALAGGMLWLVLIFSGSEFRAFVICLATFPVCLGYCMIRSAGVFGLIYMSDQWAVGWMFRLFLARAMADGTGFPQWIPHQFGGMPYIEAFHGALLYPPKALASGSFSLVSIQVACVVALIGWLVWRYATKGKWWPEYWLFVMVAVYPIHAHLLPILTPISRNTSIAVLDLWGWVGGFGIAYLFHRWKWHYDGWTKGEWHSLAICFVLLAWIVYVSVLDSHGYAYDWMDNFARTVPADKGILILGDGRGWGWWHWITRPLVLAAGWALLYAELSREKPVSLV